MLSVNFTQADVDGAAKNVFDSHASGGVYTVWFTNAKSGGSGAVLLTLRWTSSSGDSEVRSYASGSDRNNEFLVITMQHPNTLTAELDHYTEGGSFTVDTKFYVARVKEEG